MTKLTTLLLTATMCVSLFGCSNNLEQVATTQPIETMEMAIEDISEKESSLYEVIGMRTSLDGFWFHLRSIVDLSELDINLSNNNIPEYIKNYKQYIYLDLVFDNDELISWQILDKETQQPLENIEPEFMAEYFKNHGPVLMGQLPDVLKLSKLDFNKIYAYDVELDKNYTFKLPAFINDTEFSILEIQIGYQEGFFDESIFNMNKSLKNVPNSRVLLYRENIKLYIKIDRIDVDKFLEQNNSRCFHLSNCGSENTIELHGTFNDYIYNDTDKTYTLESDSIYIDEPNVVTVLPGEIVNCDNDVRIIDVQ